MFVNHAAFQRAMWQRPRRTDTLVLDLDGPNSFDVALPLVRSRAEVRAVSGWLVCWSAAANQADAAAAVPALGCEGCTKVDVSS